MARAVEQLGGAGQRPGQIGGAVAGGELAQAIAQSQVIARQLGRQLGALGGAHDRDLGLGPELGEDRRGAADLLGEQGGAELGVAAGEAVVED
ncbi:MAG: hypothetical protein R2939_04895 [Kofleriaceae bacterium]